MIEIILKPRRPAGAESPFGKIKKGQGIYHLPALGFYKNSLRYY